MNFQTGIGFSQALDPEAAAKEAAFKSKTALNSDRIDLAVVFSTVHYDPQRTIPVLQTVLNKAKMIGSSTAGLILSHSIESRGIAVLTLRSDDITFGIGAVEGLNKQDVHKAGNYLAREALGDSGRQKRNVFFYWVDGQIKNNSDFLKGVHETFGNIFPIIGAASSDDFHFSQSFQMYNDQDLRHSAVGLIMGGHSALGIGCRHGWRPLGKPRIVDRAEENIVHTIAGQKASNLYLEYFGAYLEELRSDRFGRMSILYPLGINIPDSPEYLLRNIVDILPDGSILCQGDIPEGAEIHIMIGNKDSCKQAAIEAAEEAKSGLLGKTPKLVLIFESMARRKLLGRNAYSEIEHIKHILGTDVPLIGMYTNGEICPYQTSEKFNTPYFLNGSLVVVAVS